MLNEYILLVSHELMLYLIGTNYSADYEILSQIISHKLCWFNSKVTVVLLYRVKYSMKLEGVTLISLWCARQLMCMCESLFNICNFIVEMEKPN